MSGQPLAEAKRCAEYVLSRLRPTDRRSLVQFDQPGDGLKRVILLSGCLANEGLTEPAEIAAQCAQWAGRGITTSAYGLGHHFSEELMIAMARAGGSSSCSGNTAEDLHEPFERELDPLVNLCLREWRMAVPVPEGVEAEVLSDQPRIEVQWHLPDLAWAPRRGPCCG